MAENSPVLKKETDNQVQKAQRVPNKINRLTPRHLKRDKVKEDSKGSKRKTMLITRELPIRLTDDFSTEALQARKEWQNTFQVLKGKNLQPRILYPARLSFRI